MKSKTADITAKYQKMIDNIQWHLKTNKPTDKMELQKLYQQINDYREMIVDLETVASQFQHPVPDEAGEVYVWVKAMERLPDIDNKNPKHYLFLNEVNHHAIDIWTEFITNFPPLITSRLFDWKWLSPAPPSGEDAGKGWISVEDRLPTEKDADENGKVLVYRNTNEGQKGLSKSIFDYFMVKNCDSDTVWQPLPPKP